MLAKQRTHVDVYIQTKNSMQNIIRYKITNQPGLYNKSKHPIIEANKTKIEGINNNGPLRRNGPTPKCDRLVMRQSKEISEATFYLVCKERAKLFIKKYYHIH